MIPDLQMNLSFLRRSINLPQFFGVCLFVGMMAAGYYYNLTFVQLGLEDFGTRMLGLSESAVARDMALLAICTCGIALVFGRWMQRRNLRRKFQTKLQICFGIVLTQTLLTLVIPAVYNEITFVIWLVLVSVALGIGVPVMFSLTIDLVPVKQRGIAAALVTALAYFAAEILSDEWTYEFFRTRLLLVLAVGTLGLGVLAYTQHPWLEIISKQHQQPEFAIGRFVRQQANQTFRPSLSIVGLIALMFGIYFIDSLGFLRLLKVPGFMEITWQSPIFGDRLFIASIHVIGALIAGVLYQALNVRHLFFWTFGIFALTHLQYSLQLRATGETLVTLAMPMLYALAVSLYTVINFTIWADLSTPDTVSFNSALGVAFSGWTATFLSTGLAIFWQGQGLYLERHIQIVDALAMLLFLVMLALAFIRKTEHSI
jgi:MFS family permease